MAVRAARYASKADIASLERVVSRTEAEIAGERYAELDSAFRHLIARSTHNQLLAYIVGISSEWTRDIRNSALHDLKRRRVSTEGYKQVFEASRLQDPEVTAAAMPRHLRTVDAQLTSRDGLGHAPRQWHSGTANPVCLQCVERFRRLAKYCSSPHEGTIGGEG